jgi:hypothetical protein
MKHTNGIVWFEKIPLKLPLKFIYSEKAQNFAKSPPIIFQSTASQMIGVDFAKFCGLPRIYEL